MTGLDFEPGEDVRALRDLTAEILTDLATVERIREVEAGGGHDAKLWETLATAGVLGACLPQSHGGLGMLGLATVLEQVGRHVAPVRLAAIVCAALTLTDAGRPADDILSGQRIVTGAWTLDAAGQVHTAQVVSTVATRPLDRPGARPLDRPGSHLSGVFPGVAAAPVADAVLVPCTRPDGSLVVAFVPTHRDGVSVAPDRVTDQGCSGTLTLSEVAVSEDDVVGDESLVEWTLTRLRVAHAATQVGVCARAVELAASYTSQRHQFGRPLSTNQAVAVRAADAHLDTEAIRLTALRAAWLLDRGEDAHSAALVASWWASTGGLRVVHATQHLHGGMGADLDYPLHRYFLWGRHLALTPAAAGATLAELGDLLPIVPPIGGPG